MVMGGILIAATFFSSCVSEEKEDVGPEPVGRLVLFYMGGDNNLSDEVRQKTNAIMRGWNPRTGDRLLVFSDVVNGPAQLAEVTSKNGDNVLEVLKAYGEVNSADRGMVARVLNDVTLKYKADSYGLVVFSHATGWLPAGAINNPINFMVIPAEWEVVDVEFSRTRTIVTDGSHETDMKEFASALPDGMFDFIVFEACLMSGIEVAYEFKNKTDYILSSSAEILSPGFTDAYSAYVDYLFAHDLQGFAGKAFDYYDSKSGYMRSATLSLIKTSGLDALGAWARDNCDHKIAVDVNSVQCFNRNAYPLVFDFCDYFSRLSTPDKAAEMEALVGKCVVWKKATPEFMRGLNGFEILKHSGLTTYIKRVEFPALNAEYSKLKWHGALGI